jgi:hypothetical protein
MWSSYHLVNFCKLPSHPPGRSVLVDYPELHLAPRILPLPYLLRYYHFTLALTLASVSLVLVHDHTGHIVTVVVD